MRAIEIDQELSTIPLDGTREVNGYKVTRITRKEGKFSESGYVYRIDGHGSALTRFAAVNWLMRHGEVEQ